MKTIHLSQGKTTTVDDVEFPALSEFQWSAVKVKTANKVLWYASRNTSAAERALGLPHVVSMHRQILMARADQWVDHADGNGLNNLRSNLRFCTILQNNVNARRRPARSGYRGVRLRKKTVYAAEMKVNGRTRIIGTSKDPAEAARLYDAAAVLHYGPFAVLNFPETNQAIA